MLGETHGRVARKIAQEIGLSETEAMVLEVGSFSLSKKGRFLQDKDVGLDAAESIIRSRILFLEGSIECFSCLGNAIRCIQDMWMQNPKGHVDYAVSGSRENTAEIVSESELPDKIRVMRLSDEAQQNYISQLKRIIAGPFRLGGDEISPRWRPGSDGLCEKIIAYALAEPTSAMNNAFLNLNFAYRICLKVSRLVVTPVNPVVHVSSQVFDYETEQRRLRSKLRGFPASYLESNQDFVILEEVAFVKEDNLVQVNNAFEEWIGCRKDALDYAIFPLYGNRIEDLGDGFRLTLKMEVREKTKAGFANPYVLPALQMDFSSFVEAKYAEEAFFEILLHQKKGTVLDRVGFIIDGLLKMKFPARIESMTGILDTREDDLKKDSALTNIISELKRIYDPTWDDLGDLRRRLANIGKGDGLEVFTK